MEFVGIFIASYMIAILWLVYFAINKYYSLKMFEIDINLKLESVDALLEGIIENGLSEYLLENVLYKDIKYITDKIESEINTGVADIVAKRLSNTVMNRLKIYYHEEAIYDVISYKINIIVMNYVLEFNSKNMK